MKKNEKLVVCLYGIRGTLLQWLREFLTGRTHQTRVRFSLSSVTQLLSGVVQGRIANPRPVATIKTGRIRMRL